MIRKTLTYSVIIVFCILLAIIFLEKRNVARLQRMLVRDNTKSMQDSIRIESLKYLVLTHGNCIRIKMEKDFLLSDRDNHNVRLEEVLGNNTKYVYYFSENNCLTCVESYLAFLKKASDKIGKDNVIILGSYEKPKNLFLTLAKYDLYGIPVYNLSPSYLMNEMISKVNAPFMFRIDSLLNVSQVYFPEKGLPELSVLYSGQIAL